MSSICKSKSRPGLLTMSLLMSYFCFEIDLKKWRGIFLKIFDETSKFNEVLIWLKIVGFRLLIPILPEQVFPSLLWIYTDVSYLSNIYNPFVILYEFAKNSKVNSVKFLRSSFFQLSLKNKISLSFAQFRREPRFYLSITRQE